MKLGYNWPSGFKEMFEMVHTELCLLLIGFAYPINFPWVSGTTTAYLRTGTNQYTLKILKLFNQK